MTDQSKQHLSLADRSTQDLLAEVHTTATERSENWDAFNDSYWELVSALHFRDEAEVFDKGMAWCESNVAFERELGVDVLSQLLRKDPNAKFGWFKPHAEQTVPVFLRLLNDADLGVVSSAIFALGHNDYPDGGIYLRFVEHDSIEIRYAVTHALPSAANRVDPKISGALIKLMQDEDEDIRNWATFGLQCTEADSAEIRAAFVDRLNDAHDETRAEALIGLAQLQDPRTKQFLKDELNRGTISDWLWCAFEELKDPTLLSMLHEELEFWPDSAKYIDGAIKVLKKVEAGDKA